MAAGTLAGGWRIVRTMGSQDNAADADAGRLRGNRRLGDAVCGDQSRHSGIDHPHHHRLDHRRRRGQEVSAVRWSVAKEIVTAWIITIPAAGLLAALFYWLIGLFG